MSDHIMARVDVSHIDMLNKIIEAYDHLGIVSTLDRREGLVIIRVTPDTREEIVQILEHLPFPLYIMNG